MADMNTFPREVCDQEQDSTQVSEEQRIIERLYENANKALEAAERADSVPRRRVDENTRNRVELAAGREALMQTLTKIG
jgi:hypothetical protein